MRLTTKGRYAVTAMLDLALNAENKPISLADISRRQDISLSYLEQLFSKLRQQGLVSSVRGPGGGYKLSRDAEAICVAEIIDAVNESIDATNCGGSGNCSDGQICLTHHLWCDLSDQIHQFLSSISLAGLVARNDVREVAERQNRERDREQTLEFIGAGGA
ncbi:MAG: Fe-S cluster assembly transcriptional regulator IscR [Gammaproteobacteria bacterium]|uniref:Fe-S cluster assembly transcriptional regulator IscR n=1 Tax=Pseudomaricurvus alcaniphilus TaxID=1166482 RepID=UPI00140D4893|nr:Fe-S cluster assembly transcriptional regulator IscR [Pseudomaricurvus alcaniphilus]MBR9911192.1 Fe-S cluster assembly transcriptional regulator IscR [Gammaproteobacteria bacterium]NHN37571.1 Fe-S cluster assembly transcriptional regulator IscR [Pseudomaricurvus alcaniphilus]